MRSLHNAYSLYCADGNARRSAGIGPGLGGTREREDMVAEAIQGRLDGAGELVQRTLPSTRTGKSRRC